MVAVMSEPTAMAAAEKPLPALGHHGGAQDTGFHGGVGHGGAGDAAHEGGEHDGDLRQAARHPADGNQRHLEQAGGDAAFIHQVAGEYEERHGQQREALAHRGDLLHADGHGHALGGEEEDEAGNAGRKGDWHAEDHENDEDDTDQGHG